MNRLNRIEASDPTRHRNAVTSWLDLSQVYGSSQEKSDKLRAGWGGRLLESQPGYPPTNCSELGIEMAPGNQGRNSDFCVGDVRGNENNNLLALHILFFRNHQWYASQCPSNWTDEMCFQWSRAMNIAEYQAIVFYEWLPLYVGESYFKTHLEQYNGYNDLLDGTVSVEFTQAALRISRSLITQKIPFDLFTINPLLPDFITNYQTEYLELKQTLFAPGSLMGYGSIEAFLSGAIHYPAQEIGPQLAKDIITSSDPSLPSLHLGAVDCERGRDTGVIDYMTLRQQLGLSGSNLTDITTAAHNLAILNLYQTIDPTLKNIDLWVGAMLEDHTQDGLVGNVGQYLISQEFKRIRDADRLWFESPENTILTCQQKKQLRYHSSIANIIKRLTKLNNLVIKQESLFKIN